MTHHPLSISAEGTPQERFGFLLGVMARLWRTEIDRRLAPHGLTQARWQALVNLSRMQGTVTQRDLAEAAGVQGPTLVRTLDWLEEQGLIERGPIPGDRRAKSVSMTPKAGPVMEHIWATATAVRAEIFQDIDETEIARCLELFERIAHRLDHVQEASPTHEP